MPIQYDDIELTVEYGDTPSTTRVVDQENRVLANVHTIAWRVERADDELAVASIELLCVPFVKTDDQSFTISITSAGSLHETAVEDDRGRRFAGLRVARLV